MDRAKFDQIVGTGKPVVFEFWAPWCGPCKAMTPLYARAEKEYQNKVTLVKVNVDQSPDLARALHIFSIPTVIAFRQGAQVVKKTGAMSYENLVKVFDGALQSGTKTSVGISNSDRWIRILIAFSLLVLAAITGKYLLFFSLAGITFFFAMYDRCPIWRVITRYFQKSGQTSETLKNFEE
jgi:thioredoxin